MSALIRSLTFLVALVALGSADPLHADESTFNRRIGERTYRLRLVFEDDFDNLEQWQIESTGKVAVKDNQLLWNCLAGQAGTIWCKQEFGGPTVVEFDAVAAAGARNLNFIFYATHPDGLLETTNTRTGKYSQYHTFPNYIVTYLTPPLEGRKNVFSESQWRVRFRKNPGFQLLTERLLDTNVPVGRRQRVTYVLADKGRMELFVDGQLLHAHQDPSSPYRRGHHGFRTWNSEVHYSGFKVYSIVSGQDE